MFKPSMETLAGSPMVSYVMSCMGWAGLGWAALRPSGLRIMNISFANEESTREFQTLYLLAPLRFGTMGGKGRGGY